MHAKRFVVCSLSSEGLVTSPVMVASLSGSHEETAITEIRGTLSPFASGLRHDYAIKRASGRRAGALFTEKALGYYLKRQLAEATHAVRLILRIVARLGCVDGHYV